VKSCIKCQLFEPLKTQAPVMTPIRVSEPLELVGIDLVGPLAESNGHKYVLTMTDYFTKVSEINYLLNKFIENDSLLPPVILYATSFLMIFIILKGCRFSLKVNSLPPPLKIIFCPRNYVNNF